MDELWKLAQECRSDIAFLYEDREEDWEEEIYNYLLQAFALGVQKRNEEIQRSRQVYATEVNDCHG